MSVEPHLSPAKLDNVSSASRKIDLFANGLSALIVGFGLLTLVTTASIVIRSYSPVPYWDQWEIVRTLIAGHGHVSLSQLWAQHNEHRILLGRLLSLADLFWFHGRNVSLLIEIFVIQLLHLMILAGVLWRFGAFRHTAFLTVLGFLTYCKFSPLQIDNFDWGFQTALVMAPFAASACFAAALWYRTIAASNTGRRLSALFICLLAALIAEASSANGVLVWPLLLYLAWILDFRRREKCIFAVISITGIGIYMAGYHSPPWHTDPLKAIHAPFELLRYVITYFAASWDAGLPNSSNWPRVSESVTIVAISTALINAIACCFRRYRCTLLDAFLFANMLFALVTAFLTALGRINFGLSSATDSRYQTVALLFWGCFAALLAKRLQLPMRKWVMAQVALLIVLLSAADRWQAIEQGAFQRQTKLAEGWDALLRGLQSDPALSNLYPSPKALWWDFLYFRQHHWGPHGIVGRYPRLRQGRRTTRIAGFELTPSACLGFLDFVTKRTERDFSLGGWAWDLQKRAPPARVVLVSHDGRTISSTSVGMPRPDVAKGVSSASWLNTGWDMSVRLANNGTYDVFAIVGASSACPLNNELQITRDTLPEAQ